MLNWIYHVAFEAHAEITNWMLDEKHGMVEGYFVGKHTGDFAGTAPTGNEIRGPLCVTYDLRDGQITRGRIYNEAQGA
jgi:predicted ester cyclase